MKKLLLLLLTTFLSLSCSTNRNSVEKIPKDFYFNLDWGNEYFSSRKNAFYRQYERSIDSVKVKFTKSEKAKAFKLIHEFKFDSFPESFENNLNEIPTDAGNHVLKITVCENGKLKTVSYDDRNVTESKKEKAKPFLELFKKLEEIVKQKEAVKNMSNSTID
jgi:hypothetical protein